MRWLRIRHGAPGVNNLLHHVLLTRIIKMSSSLDNVWWCSAGPHHEWGHAGVGSWEHGPAVSLGYISWKIVGGETIYQNFNERRNVSCQPDWMSWSGEESLLWFLIIIIIIFILVNSLQEGLHLHWWWRLRQGRHGWHWWSESWPRFLITGSVADTAPWATILQTGLWLVNLYFINWIQSSNWSVTWVRKILGLGVHWESLGME